MTSGLANNDTMQFIRQQLYKIRNGQSAEGGRDGAAEDGPESTDSSLDFIGSAKIHGRWIAAVDFVGTTEVCICRSCVLAFTCGSQLGVCLLRESVVAFPCLLLSVSEQARAWALQLCLYLSPSMLAPAQEMSRQQTLMHAFSLLPLPQNPKTPNKKKQGKGEHIHKA